MKLDQALNKKEYYTKETLKENVNRVKFLNKYEEKIQKIKKRLFDDYDVEDIYITGQILEKQRFSPDKLNLFFEMDKKEFEKFVDSHEVRKSLYKDISVLIKSEDIVYVYNHKWEAIDFNKPIVLI